MNIPDYISPIIGWRVWRWDTTGLKSLNGKPWSPGQPLAAKCGAGNVHDAHEPPQAGCTCGVYAAKSREHLRQLGYDGHGIRGEVHLWGTVVEHEFGWRAQFAYPKSLVLPPDLIPSGTKEMESRLGALAAYDIDIFIVGGGRSIPLCRKGSGFDAAGLDYLIGKHTQYYDRRQRDRTLMKGDRVAVLGRGIVVVEQADDMQVHAAVWNKCELRIARKEIVWDEGNMRWETNPSSVSQDQTEGDKFRPQHRSDRRNNAWTTSTITARKSGL
jgi:hypothetical protein